MRRLGTQGTGLLSSAPALAIVVYDSETQTPQFVLTQEPATDMPSIKVNGVELECLDILNDLTITSARPASSGGLRRNTVKASLQTDNPNGLPFTKLVWGPGLYYGGVNQDSFYFVVYGFDRSTQFGDITNGACYGCFKIDQQVDWTEKSGQMPLNLIDVTLTEDEYVGATDEIIPDFFFYYNSWYGGDFFPKVFGQVSRVRMMNAFPSFNTKQLANSINGILYTAYLSTDGAGTVLVLEEQVDKSSLLLQLVALGGVVRIKFKNGEVMSGTLAHDTGANTVTFTIVSRNTYYAQVGAYSGDKLGKTPDQWPTPACYSTVDLDVGSICIKDAKNTVIDPNGWVQAPNFNFYDGSAVDKNDPRTNISTQMLGLMTQRKDTVLIKPFRDPLSPTTVQNVNISSFFTITSNANNFPVGFVIDWGVELFEFEKYYNTTRPLNLFINNPTTANAGGATGDNWAVVGVDTSASDLSGYIRNGGFHLDANHVYCEGEGKLIQIPPANVASVTDSVSAYGLARLGRITLTAAPLDLNIGAKTNVIYTDCMFTTAHTYDAWLPKVMNDFLSQEAPFLYALASARFKDPSVYTVNGWPFPGIPIYSNTTVTEVLDKICYQFNVVIAWDRGLFDIQLAALYFSNQRTVTIDSIDYIQPLFLSTDQDEMLENSRQLQIGKLKTIVEDGYEHIALHLKTSFGSWQDPFFAQTTNDVNRGLKPASRIISYAFDYINDGTSFENALGMALSIGHASGYSTIQKRAIVDLSMQGCRWEALDPIILKHFPMISDDNSNVFYDDNDNLLYLKGSQDFFIMGAVCVIDQVDYVWSVINPHVTINCRMSQIYVNDVSGVTSGSNGPPTPPLGTDAPVPSTDPNSPPNKGGKHNSSGNYGAGLNYPMPLEVQTPATFNIDSTTPIAHDFNVTADDGFIYDKGYDYQIFIHNIDSQPGVALSGAAAGSFPDKSGTPEPVYIATLTVDYRWFLDLGSDDKDVILECIRYLDPEDPTANDSHYVFAKVHRVPLKNIVAS